MNKKPLFAAWMLVLATFFWGSSFLTMKALVMEQQRLAPETNSWLLASLSLVFRFGGAAVILMGWKFSELRQVTRLEIWEGVILGIVGGGALLLQMDGVNYTSASTSAFLTQCYCLFIPVIVACRQRAWPAPMVVVSSVMVLIGVAILSGFNFQEMRLGRGEWETLLASLLFTAQILWLERPRFAPNRPHNFTIVMFVTIAVLFLPVPWLSGHGVKITAVYGSSAALWFSLLLMGLCTLVAYTLMNYWQPHVSATQAGLIYCSEPVFTMIFALFLPGWFSVLAPIVYHNEAITLRQLIGGGLITAANVLILGHAARTARRTAAVHS